MNDIELDLRKPNREDGRWDETDPRKRSALYDSVWSEAFESPQYVSSCLHPVVLFCVCRKWPYYGLISCMKKPATGVENVCKRRPTPITGYTY
jgi:hypothetical protein